MANDLMEKIKQLRELSGAGVMDAKKALEENGGDIEKSAAALRAKGIEKAAKKSDRATESGLVYAYIHGEGQVGSLVELNCETSFVAKTDDFKKLAHEVALQVVSMAPENVEELTKQAYIRDAKQTIQDLISEVIAKTGENITIKRFSRFALGE